MSLDQYQQKRDFSKTQEPKGQVAALQNFLFVIQKHAASHLHYDFRLELNGVLKSWAVPKGPCLDPKIKRLAMHVEDHPVEYGNFEGIIPKGEYGGGTVMVWDTGLWQPLDDDPHQAYKEGHLRFELKAQKLKGRWDLLRLKKEDKSWFLIKYKDRYAKSLNDYDITITKPNSVLSKQSLEEIAENFAAIWTRKGSQKAKPSALKKKPTKKIKLELPESPFPKTLSPQLATLVDKPPQGDNWLHEVKLDGYRILALKEGKKVNLLSRNNKEWTDKFPNIVAEISRLAIKNVIIDGEIVLLDKTNRSSFQLLQNSLKEGSQAPFIYYLFDLLYYERYDTRTLPLLERKKLLASVISKITPNLRFSDHIIGHAKEIFSEACHYELEGIISKQIASPYTAKRSKSWLKIKCLKQQEFVIGGFSPSTVKGKYFGSLFLGFYNHQRELVYSGKVGTGFTEATVKSLSTQMRKLVTDKNPFSSKPPGLKTATWLKPKLIAEIQFTEWTDEGSLRHPSFQGLRIDKKAKEIIKEREVPVEKIANTKAAKKNSFIITNPQKLLYPKDGITKQDLLSYYETIHRYILPFVSKRPLTLVRCPETFAECFFQKHYNRSTPSALQAVAVKNKKTPGHEEYIYLDNREGLLSLVQMGVLEIHPWGSRIDNLEYPDIITFDLDPAPELPWNKVVKAAFVVKQTLEQFNLKSFVKTTGGKGLHVVIPIKPTHNWDVIKNFAHSLVLFLEQEDPDKYTTSIAKKRRQGKIFIDYLRNQRDATAIAAYSTRARPHAPVATPISWDELSKNSKDTAFTIHSLPPRLDSLKTDPWEEFWKIKQTLKIK